MTERDDTPRTLTLDEVARIERGDLRHAGLIEPLCATVRAFVRSAQCLGEAYQALNRRHWRQQQAAHRLWRALREEAPPELAAAERAALAAALGEEEDDTRYILGELRSAIQGATEWWFPQQAAYGDGAPVPIEEIEAERRLYQALKAFDRHFDLGKD